MHLFSPSPPQKKTYISEEDLYHTKTIPKIDKYRNQPRAI